MLEVIQAAAEMKVMGKIMTTTPTKSNILFLEVDKNSLSRSKTVMINYQMIWNSPTGAMTTYSMMLQLLLLELLHLDIIIKIILTISMFKENPSFNSQIKSSKFKENNCEAQKYILYFPLYSPKHC